MKTDLPSTHSMLTESLHPYQRGFLRLCVWDNNSQESSQENVFKGDILRNLISSSFVHHSQQSELFKASFSCKINFRLVTKQFFSNCVQYVWQETLSDKKQLSISSSSKSDTEEYMCTVGSGVVHGKTARAYVTA